MPFHSKVRALLYLAFFVATVASVDVDGTPHDPCTIISGQKWVAPKDLRTCFSSIKLDPAVQENIVQVINKTMAFHTSVNYQLKAPEPFTADVHENIFADLARIQKQSYASEFDLHIDVMRTLNRFNDGHCFWANNCFVTMFFNYLPIPLALLTGPDGSQNVYIAPEAFAVASTEFADQIDVWQNALPGPLKGQLATLSGAKVLQINGQDPFVAVNANAEITGTFQAFGTRQNMFFSGYNRGETGWTYIMGDFAQQSIPLSDSVTLTILRTNHTLPEVIVVPYRARIGDGIVFGNDTASWRANNCVPVLRTNGKDEYATVVNTTSTSDSISPVIKYQQQPPLSPEVARRHPLNVILKSSPLSDVGLPPGLQPVLPSLNGSKSVMQFYMLKDGKTGAMALGSFADRDDLNTFLLNMLQGLLSLKSSGATQLIVDVSNNGGGFACAAHWLHRILVGAKSTTVPKSGPDTKARDGPLAQLIVKQIANNNADPQNLLIYNPLMYSNASDVLFSAGTDWLQPPVNTVINGRPDAFSQRLGEECPDSQWPTPPPETALFDGEKVAIVSNGQCASSCSLFSITMSKQEGSKTVVLGGKKDVQQQYCGTVGGQSTDFSVIKTQLKTTHLQNHTLAPPDLLVNGVLGIAWRLAFGYFDPTQPEEWQSRPADVNLPITADIVNNPVAIWEVVAQRVFS